MQTAYKDVNTYIKVTLPPKKCFRTLEIWKEDSKDLKDVEDSLKT